MGESAQKDSRALAKAGGGLTGTFHTVKAINERLESVAAQPDKFHLVSPATSVGTLPEGFGVALSIVQLDPGSDAYGVGMGNFGVLKHGLDRIANAAGITWDDRASARTDDRRHPFYCSYRAVGSWLQFDGQTIRRFDEVELDLRDGSAEYDLIFRKARSDSSAQQKLMDMRRWILRHTITRARLRVIKQLGIKTAYTAEELSKPFVCATLHFTARSRDPETQRELSMMNARAFLGARSALYGPPAPTHEPSLAPMLPPSTGPVAFSEAGYDDDFIEAEASCSAPTPAPSQRRDEAPAGRQAEGGAVLRFGREKGTPIAEAEEESLEWYAGALRKSIDDPAKARWRGDNEADLRAVEDELRKRRGEVVEDEDSWVEGRE